MVDEAASAARPRAPTTGSQNRPPSSFIWPSATKATSCRFMAQSAKASAGPLVETLTRRVYHDAGEAKFQKEEQKDSLGIGRRRGFSGDDGRRIGNRTRNECAVAGQRTASYSVRGGNLRRQSGDLSCLRQGKSPAQPGH